MPEETYELEITYPGVFGDERQEKFSWGEDNFGEAVQKALEVVRELLDLEMGFWESPDKSPVTLIGDEINLKPFIQASYEIGLFAADETEEVTFKTDAVSFHLRTL